MKTIGERLLPVVAILAALSTAADAKIPPLSEKNRVRQAALIIEGIVLATEPVGGVTRDACYGWQRYKARVTVEKVWKGGPVPKVITVTYSTKVEDKNMCDGGRVSYFLREGERIKLYLAGGRDGAPYYFFNSTCLERAPVSPAARAGSPGCVPQVRKLIQDGYNDGLMELVELDGPYSWTEGDKKLHAFMVTYCNPGDTSSKARRRARCKKTRASELRIATCSAGDPGGIVDTNGDKFVDLSDLVRGVRDR